MDDIVGAGRGVEPPRSCDRRILSPILGRLQQAARQRQDSQNVHRIKDLRAISILQDVAVYGSNVAGEHAPEHALNLVPRWELNTCYRRERTGATRNFNNLKAAKCIGTHRNDSTE